jgi:putative hydrolase
LKYELDTHCHTIASGHAYSTLEEMVKSASKKGLKLIGITDHAPMMPGSTQIYYFHNIKVIPNEMYGVEVLKGVEANIINHNGEIDMDEQSLMHLDVVIASLHPPCIGFATKEENTQAVIGAIKHPRVNIIGHPDDSRYPLDYEAVVLAAKEHHVLLELNNSSLNPKIFRQNAPKNVKLLLELCVQYNHPIILGSDAHISFDVANFQEAQVILDAMNFPENLVINSSVELLKKYLDFKK